MSLTSPEGRRRALVTTCTSPELRLEYTRAAAMDGECGAVLTPLALTSPIPGFNRMAKKSNQRQ